MPQLATHPDKPRDPFFVGEQLDAGEIIYLNPSLGPEHTDVTGEDKGTEEENMESDTTDSLK